MAAVLSDDFSTLTKNDLDLKKEINMSLIQFGTRSFSLQECFEAARAEIRQRPHPSPAFITTDTKPAALLRKYLRPYQAFFAPQRLGLEHVSTLLGVSPNTFGQYLYKGDTMPYPLLVGLLNLLEVQDPSWLTFLFHKTLLEKYFDVKVVEGKIILVTKPGRDERPIDYGSLSVYGLGGMIHEARILNWLTLQQAEERIESTSAAAGVPGPIRRTTLSRYELNLESPSRANNSDNLDVLITGLQFNPSAACIGAERPWIPRLIPVLEHHAWDEKGENAIPITPTDHFPYPLLETHYKPPRAMEGALLPGKGFGGIVRQARLLSGFGLDEAAALSQTDPTWFNRIEINDEPVTFDLLQWMATHYAKAIKKLALYSENPLHELTIRYNLNHYPNTPQEHFMTKEGPLLLTSPEDAEDARILMPLPEDHFLKKLFVFRMSRHWGRQQLWKKIGWEIHYSNLKNPEAGYIPPFALLTAMALLEDESGETLEEWRNAVRVAAYPEIPWEFLESEDIYPASPRDRALIAYYFQIGAFHEEHLGWLLARYRMSLAVNQSLKEMASFCKASWRQMDYYERAKLKPQMKKLFQITRATALELAKLKRAWQKTFEKSLESQDTTEPRFPHVAQCTKKTVPQDRYTRGLKPRQDYYLYESGEYPSYAPEVILEGITQTVLDNLAHRPYMILTCLPFSLEAHFDEDSTSYERFRQKFKRRLRLTGVKNYHIVWVFRNLQLHFSATKGSLKNSHITSEESQNHLLFAKQEVEVFLSDKRIPVEKVSPYPQKAKKNPRVAAALRYPELTHWFPHSVPYGYLHVPEEDWPRLQQVFAQYPKGSRLPKTQTELLSTARFLSVPPSFLWLCRNRGLLATFPVCDLETGQLL